MTHLNEQAFQEPRGAGKSHVATVEEGIEFALREMILAFDDSHSEESERWWEAKHDEYVPFGKNGNDVRADVLERARAALAKAVRS